MFNSVGKKLQQARINKHLSVEEAARATRIRPDKLAELEEDNYANFPSMSYAKGFLMLYARFLDIDISEFTETLHTPNPVSSDDYEYINAGATGAPPPPSNRPYTYNRKREHSILPILIFAFLAGAIVLCIFVIVTFQRLGNMDESTATGKTDVANSPASSPAISTLPPNPVALASPVPVSPKPASPVPKAPSPAVIASSPAPSAVASAPTAAATPTATASPGASPPMLAPVPIPSAGPGALINSDRDVRRAEPIAQPSHQSAAAMLAATPGVAAGPAFSSPGPSASPSASAVPLKQVVIRPIRKTRVIIRKDVADSVPIFEDWLYPGAGSLKLTGHKFWIRIEDPGALEITEDGRPLPVGQSDVHIE